jgi:carboxyl-terminal processing protease
VRSSALRSGAPAADAKVADVPAHMPPKLVVDHGGTLVTRQASLRVRGRASDDMQVRDVYIFVGSHKVFYQSNREAKDPKTVSFDATLPLRPGTNYITVFAREDNEVVSREIFIVRRDGPDGALLETPKAIEIDDVWDFLPME